MKHELSYPGLFVIKKSLSLSVQITDRDKLLNGVSERETGCIRIGFGLDKAYGKDEGKKYDHLRAAARVTPGEMSTCFLSA